MKHKRLNRDGWGFQLFPYYQMRVDNEDFHGLVCLIRLLDGEEQYWHDEAAGRLQVCGPHMTWMQLIPDNQKRVITVKYFPFNERDKARKHYPVPADERYQPSVWYVDVIEGIEYDKDGVAVYIDKYLDVIFIPEGKVDISDRDELDAAYAAGDITKEQYEEALQEGDRIVEELCSDIAKTDAWCAKIRDAVEQRIAAGESPMFLYHGSRYDLDVIKPQQAQDDTVQGSQLAVYAAKSAKEVIPFALPIKPYPDSPEGKCCFMCDNGRTEIIYGSLDPNGKGYIYRCKSDSFTKADEWQWVSTEPVKYLDRMEIPVSRFWDTVKFSEEATEIERKLYGDVL